MQITLKIRRRWRKFIIALLALFFQLSAAFTHNPPKLFLFLGAEHDLKKYRCILSNASVTGVQIIYRWKELEPKKNAYDFSILANDLKYLDSIHKKLFAQIQDRSFQPKVFNVPDYLRKEETYHGGIAKQIDFSGEKKALTEGWVAKIWDRKVRKRFQALFKNLASKFDGKIYGINLAETAVDFDDKHPPEGFTPDLYFEGELENARSLSNAFHKSIVVQYVNFFPGEWGNDHHYMSRLFSFAIKYHIGLGGPDVVPYRKAQMKNSYLFFHKYKDRLSNIAMAIQQPDYTYINPQTGKPFQWLELYSFAKNYLGANILFWNIQEPFFSTELKPRINSKYFEKN